MFRTGKRPHKAPTVLAITPENSPLRAETVRKLRFKLYQEVFLKAVTCMHTDRPVTLLSNGAAPGKLPGLRVFLMFLLAAGLLSATALAAPPPGSKTQAAPATPAAPASHAEFVGQLRWCQQSFLVCRPAPPPFSHRRKAGCRPCLSSPQQHRCQISSLSRIRPSSVSA